jgi:hypothetical protein
MDSKGKSVTTTLDQGSKAFNASWTRNKSFKDNSLSTPERRKEDLNLSLMTFTRWNRPAKKGASTITYWVAAEVDERRLDERRKNLRHPHIRFVREFIVDAIVDHNVHIARLANPKISDEEIDILRDADFEWWDQIKPCPRHEINAENVETITLDYQLDLNWKADNEVMSKLGAVLYQGLLTNNPHAPQKDRVLAKSIAEHMKEGLRVSLSIPPLDPSPHRFFANATSAQSCRPRLRSSVQTLEASCEQEESCGKEGGSVLVCHSKTASEAPQLYA